MRFSKSPLPLFHFPRGDGLDSSDDCNDSRVSLFAVVLHGLLFSNDEHSDFAPSPAFSSGQQVWHQQSQT